MKCFIEAKPALPKLYQTLIGIYFGEYMICVNTIGYIPQWKRPVNCIYLFCFTTFIISCLCFLSDHPVPIYYMYLLKCCLEHNLII